MSYHGALTPYMYMSLLRADSRYILSVATARDRARPCQCHCALQQQLEKLSCAHEWTTSPTCSRPKQGGLVVQSQDSSSPARPSNRHRPACWRLLCKVQGTLAFASPAAPSQTKSELEITNLQVTWNLSVIYYM